MLPAPADGAAPGYFGVYPAMVTDLVDPDSLGRIEVRFPFLGADGDRDVRAWATLCTPYADANAGLQIRRLRSARRGRERRRRREQRQGEAIS